MEGVGCKVWGREEGGVELKGMVGGAPLAVLRLGGADDFVERLTSLDLLREGRGVCCLELDGGRG